MDKIRITDGDIESVSCAQASEASSTRKSDRLSVSSWEYFPSPVMETAPQTTAKSHSVVPVICWTVLACVLVASVIGVVIYVLSGDSGGKNITIDEYDGEIVNLGEEDASGTMMIVKNPEAREHERQCQAVASVFTQLAQFKNEMVVPSSEDHADPDEVLDGIATALLNYVQKLCSIDLTGSPKDFSIAFARYIHAYENLGRAYANHPTIGTLGANMIEGFFRGLMGDISGGYFEKEAALNAFTQAIEGCESQIKLAEQELELCAMKYKD